MFIPFARRVRLSGLSVMALILVGFSVASSTPGFESTKINTAAAAPAPPPKGMVWLPGGEFSMGANDPPDMDKVGMKATEDARPIHRVGTVALTRN